MVPKDHARINPLLEHICASVYLAWHVQLAFVDESDGRRLMKPEHAQQFRGVASHRRDIAAEDFGQIVKGESDGSLRLRTRLDIPSRRERN
jgi:hypothetical protein